MFTRMKGIEAPEVRSGAPAHPSVERRRQPRRQVTHVHAWVVLAATVGAALTFLVSATSIIDFAYRSVPLHVAVETTAAMASIIAAQLVHGRFRTTLRLRDLLLFAALCAFAATNLLFAVLPSLFTGEPGLFRTWAPVAGAFAATALLAIAAFAPERTLRRPEAAVRRTVAALVAGAVVIAAGVLAAADALPLPVPPSAVPGGPRLTGGAVVVAVQLGSAVLFAAAAAGFTAGAARRDDPLARWIAVGATLAAFARLNYAMFPSLYTAWFYTGDILRLGFFAAVFAGAVQETAVLRRELARAAVVDERHRIARNLHDGVAQDLAYIVQQLRRVADRDERPPGIERVVSAAERALDESRHATAALVRRADRPLGEVLGATAREAGEREGSAVETDLSPDIAVPPRVQEELLRIVREAVINAARHGRARHILVELRDAPHLCVRIVDDGVGFDPAGRPAGRLGLESMHARVRALDGELGIRSTPGGGTEVRVSLP